MRVGCYILSAVNVKSKIVDLRQIVDSCATQSLSGQFEFILCVLCRYHEIFRELFTVYECEKYQAERDSFGWGFFDFGGCVTCREVGDSDTGIAKQFYQL